MASIHDPGGTLIVCRVESAIKRSFTAQTTKLIHQLGKETRHSFTGSGKGALTQTPPRVQQTTPRKSPHKQQQRSSPDACRAAGLCTRDRRQHRGTRGCGSVHPQPRFYPRRAETLQSGQESEIPARSTGKAAPRPAFLGDQTVLSPTADRERGRHFPPWTGNSPRGILWSRGVRCWSSVLEKCGCFRNFDQVASNHVSCVREMRTGKCTCARTHPHKAHVHTHAQC